MSTQLLRACVLAAVLALSSGCTKDKAVDAPSASPQVARLATGSPEAAITANAALLKAGDFAGLMQNSLPPEKFVAFKAEWTKQKDDEPVTEEDRQKFATLMKQLTSPDAEATLYAEAGPKLKALELQYQNQVPTYVNMARGFAQNMAEQSKDLSESEKRQSVDAINAIGDWAVTAKFADQALLKQSIAIAVATARSLQLKTIDEVRAMDYNTAMKKGQVAFLGVKKILALYGLSIDDSLDSVKPTLVSSTADTAKVKVDFTLLGKSMSTETDMVRQDGRWYSKDTIEKLMLPAPTSTTPEKKAAQPVAPAKE
ncbi:MAG: hypothetical protein ABIP56_05865 [Dokdonella sp.]